MPRPTEAHWDDVSALIVVHRKGLEILDESLARWSGLSIDLKVLEAVKEGLNSLEADIDLIRIKLYHACSLIEYPVADSAHDNSDDDSHDANSDDDSRDANADDDAEDDSHDDNAEDDTDDDPGDDNAEDDLDPEAREVTDSTGTETEVSSNVPAGGSGTNTEIIDYVRHFLIPRSILTPNQPVPTWGAFRKGTKTVFKFVFDVPWDTAQHQIPSYIFGVQKTLLDDITGAMLDAEDSDDGSQSGSDDEEDNQDSEESEGGEAGVSDEGGEPMDDNASQELPDSVKSYRIMAYLDKLFNQVEAIRSNYRDGLDVSRTTLHFPSLTGL